MEYSFPPPPKPTETCYIRAQSLGFASLAVTGNGWRCHYASWRRMLLKRKELVQRGRVLSDKHLASLTVSANIKGTFHSTRFSFGPMKGVAIMKGGWREEGDQDNPNRHIIQMPSWKCARLRLGKILLRHVGINRHNQNLAIGACWRHLPRRAS